MFIPKICFEMKSLSIMFILITWIVFTSGSCDKGEIPNPEELITTMTYTLTPVGAGPVAVLSFRDLDGDGGTAPVIETDPLESGTIYLGEIELLNESTTPVEDITEEILAEAEDHQFFYAWTGSNLISIDYNDADSLGFPVGVMTAMALSGPGQGELKITLRHLPDKSAAGVNTGNIQNAGGETDIEIIFPVTVQ